MSRKSPAESATTFSVGVQKLGLDKHMWQIVTDRNLVHRWKRFGTRQEYLIHDNDSRPFVVTITDQKVVTVFKTLWTPGADYYGMGPPIDGIIEEPVIRCEAAHVFVGEDAKDNDEYDTNHGNTLLIELKKPRSYLYIGPVIYHFTVAAGDEIEQYHSYVSGDDVPMPVAVGRQNIYLMGSIIRKGDQVFMRRDQFPLNNDWMVAWSPSLTKSAKKHPIPLTVVSERWFGNPNSKVKKRPTKK